MNINIKERDMPAYLYCLVPCTLGYAMEARKLKELEQSIKLRALLGGWVAPANCTRLFYQEAVYSYI